MSQVGAGRATPWRRWWEYPGTVAQRTGVPGPNFQVAALSTPIVAPVVAAHGCVGATPPRTPAAAGCWPRPSPPAVEPGGGPDHVPRGLRTLLPRLRGAAIRAGSWFSVTARMNTQADDRVQPRRHHRRPGLEPTRPRLRSETTLHLPPDWPWADAWQALSAAAAGPPLTATPDHPPNRARPRTQVEEPDRPACSPCPPDAPKPVDQG
jgi:hypothetical protein